jgi:hypothetical protein
MAVGASSAKLQRSAVTPQMTNVVMLIRIFARSGKRQVVSNRRRRPVTAAVASVAPITAAEERGSGGELGVK